MAGTGCKMSQSSSIDSFPPSRDIEEEEGFIVHVERDVDEDPRFPKSATGKKAETLLQAVRYYFKCCLSCSLCNFYV